MYLNGVPLKINKLEDTVNIDLDQTMKHLTNHEKVNIYNDSNSQSYIMYKPDDEHMYKLYAYNNTIQHVIYDLFYNYSSFELMPMPITIHEEIGYVYCNDLCQPIIILIIIE